MNHFGAIIRLSKQLQILEFLLEDLISIGVIVCFAMRTCMRTGRYLPNNINIDDDLSTKEQVCEKTTFWDDHRFTYRAKNKLKVSFAIYDPYVKLGVGFKFHEHGSIFTAESAILSSLLHSDILFTECSTQSAETYILLWTTKRQRHAVPNALSRAPPINITNYDTSNTSDSWSTINFL